MKSKMIKLAFKNDAYSNRKADIVIFQKNMINDSVIYAWHVIHHCQYTYTHYFEYIKEPELIIKDAYENQFSSEKVKKGLLYVFSHKTGLQEHNESSDPELIEVQNLLTEGTITASIIRNSKVIYEKTEICPDEIVSFSFNNDIYIGRTESIKEGQIITEKHLERFTTKINLDQIESATIVLRGGGLGPKAQKYYFVLENIKNESL